MPPLAFTGTLKTCPTHAMKLSALTQSLSEVVADAVVVGVHEDGPLEGAAAEADRLSGGAIARLREAKEIAGKPLEVTTILAPAGLKAGQLVVVGLGKKEKLDRGLAARAAGAAAKQIAG